MRIRRLEASNFKSFADIAIDFGEFNIFIGSNASGKSNITEIVKFIREIAESSLDDAISLQGGVQFLLNLGIGRARPLRIKFVVEHEGLQSPYVTFSTPSRVDAEINQVSYEFQLQFGSTDQDYEILEDKMILSCDFVRYPSRQRDTTAQRLGKGRFEISAKDGKISTQAYPPKGVKMETDSPFGLFSREDKLPDRILLLEGNYIIPFYPSLTNLLNRISVYDFDPKLPKKAVPISGKRELSENGDNLAIALKNIVDNPAERRKLSALLQDILPFIGDIDIERYADRSLFFKLKEHYAHGAFLPASLMSDGTIAVTALIVALYFERKDVVIVEEPERNLHPSLLSKVVSALEDAAKQRQVIVTTHSPAIIRASNIRDIFLVSRDTSGFSIVTKPSDNEHLHIFLHNNIGIDQLFIDNLLEV